MTNRTRPAVAALQEAQGPIEDPLASLRDPEDVGLTDKPDVVTEPERPRGLVTEAEQDQARHTLIAAWHADSTTLGFLHKGQSCGCWYLSGVTVAAILPIQAIEPEPDGG